MQTELYIMVYIILADAPLASRSSELKWVSKEQKNSPKP